MTSHGLCVDCGLATSSYDIEARRWKCRPSCEATKPRPGVSGLTHAAILAQVAAAKPVAQEPPRLPGESRQAHRRRAREAQQQ